MFFLYTFLFLSFFAFVHTNTHTLSRWMSTFLWISVGFLLNETLILTINVISLFFAWLSNHVTCTRSLMLELCLSLTTTTTTTTTTIIIMMMRESHQIHSILYPIGTQCLVVVVCEEWNLCLASNHPWMIMAKKYIYSIIKVYKQIAWILIYSLWHRVCALLCTVINIGWEKRKRKDLDTLHIYHKNWSWYVQCKTLHNHFSARRSTFLR